MTNYDDIVASKAFWAYVYCYILNNTSNVTDRVFAIFSKLCKTFKPKFKGSAKNI